MDVVLGIVFSGTGFGMNPLQDWADQTRTGATACQISAALRSLRSVRVPGNIDALTKGWHILG